MVGSPKVRGWQPAVAAGAAAVAVATVALVLHQVAERLEPPVVCALAVGALATGAFALRRVAPYQRPIYYVLCVGACGSALSLIGALAAEGGHGGGWTPRPLGPRSAWAASAAILHGAFDLACYLRMTYCVSNGWLFRSTAVFQSAGLLNSCVVALLGAFLADGGVQWSALQAAPRALLALAVLRSALNAPQSRKVVMPSRCVLRRTAVALLPVAAVAASVRGLASMGSRCDALTLYRERVEPLLSQRQPAPFAALQGVTGLFYLAPACVALAAAVAHNPFRLWLRDVAVAAAGVAFQTEVCMVGMQWHPLTPSQHHLAPDAGVGVVVVHLSAHVLTLLGPVLCALALCRVDGCSPASASAASVAARAPLPTPPLQTSASLGNGGGGGASAAAAPAPSARHSRSSHAPPSGSRGGHTPSARRRQLLQQARKNSHRADKS